MQPRSNIEWQRFGERDPLYGVVSFEGKSRNGSDPWTEAEFYAYGAACWEEYQTRWQSYGLDTRACVEIGCGAGRITKQLALTFGAVHGVDVSDGMLAVAQRNVPEASFYLSDGARLPLDDGSVTAGFSCDVFQHFDSSAIAAAYFRELFRVLAPGGTLMIHLPVYRWPEAAKIHRLLHRLVLLRNKVRCEARRLLSSPFMGHLYYDAFWLRSTLAEIGFSRIEILYTEDLGENSKRFFRSWLFASKP